MDNIYCVAVEISPPEAAGIVAEPCHDADLVGPGQIADLLWGELSGHFSIALLEGELTFVAYGGEAFRTLSRVAASGFALSARSATLHWITYRRT